MTLGKNIIKNTGYLYFKMGITVFISLYTTRLILNSLGPSDFGIFNVIGGSIGMLGFLNSTMANATQRFMSYAEGEGNLNKKIKVFNVSMVLHAVIAIITLILLLLLMSLLFDNILNIETERVFAAKIVYYSLIFSTILTIINVPYDSIMNAHENMKYYAIIGIIESILKLMVALICVYTTEDKLIIYGMLMAMIPLFTLSIMKVYCHKHYDECVISPRLYWDYKLVKQISFFSGWNFLTAITSLFTFQGLGLVLNHFFGTILNAALGIAQQLNGQLSAFSLNLMKAFNPVIVKSAGAKNENAMNKITIAGCKFSTFLILLFAIPAMLEMPYILHKWLKVVPEWAITFCILQIIQTIICQITGSAATAIYGKGDIKNYAIYKSIMNILPLLLTYISFKIGGNPYWLYMPMILIWGIGGDIVILYYSKKKCNLDIKTYVHQVIIPIVFVMLAMIILGYTSTLIFKECFLRVVVTCILTTIAMIISIYVVGLNIEEKIYIKNILKKLHS